MPTKQPRVNVTLNEDINAALDLMASLQNTSRSAIAQSLIEKGLEHSEDFCLSRFAEERLAEGIEDSKEFSRNDFRKLIQNLPD